MSVVQLNQRFMCNETLQFQSQITLYSSFYIQQTTTQISRIDMIETAMFLMTINSGYNLINVATKRYP